MVGDAAVWLAPDREPDSSSQIVDLISWTILFSKRPVEVSGVVSVAVGAEAENGEAADEVIAGVDVEVVERLLTKS